MPKMLCAIFLTAVVTINSMHENSAAFIRHTQSWQLFNKKIQFNSDTLAFDTHSIDLISNVTETLEFLFKDDHLNIDKKDFVDIMELCAKLGIYYLHTQYDYHTSIMWFERAASMYQTFNQPTQLKILMTQIYTSLAMAYHNIGNHVQRDIILAKAQVLLALPAAISDFKSNHRVANAYYIVIGYRHYIYFEQSRKNAESIDTQKKHLQSAEKCFNETLKIDKHFNRRTTLGTHALHGIGTMHEFLGKCNMQENDISQAKKYFISSNKYFKDALVKRQELCGESHLDVARSWHKLARSNVTLSSLCKQENYQEQADDYHQKALQQYEQALSIFEKNKIPKNNAKMQELELEFNKFKTGNLSFSF